VVTLANVSPTVAIDLSGWMLVNRHQLIYKLAHGMVGPGMIHIVNADMNSWVLSKKHDLLELRSADGLIADRVECSGHESRLHEEAAVLTIVRRMNVES